MNVRAGECVMYSEQWDTNAKTSSFTWLQLYPNVPPTAVSMFSKDVNARDNTVGWRLLDWVSCRVNWRQG